MSKKVLILSSSPRKGGNSEALASIFAKGALTAAKFLAGKSAGFYDMQDVLA